MKLHKIENIKTFKEQNETVYDFTVKDDHSYVANDIIVHNSHCSTQIVSAHGMPQLYSIMNIKQNAKNKNYPLIADGGIKTSGDIVKSLAAGASAVMIGNLFAGTDEAPGEIISGQDNRLYKQYRGQASKSFMNDHCRTTVAAEGVSSFIPYKGSLESVVHELVMGVKSGLSYSGAWNISELQDNAIFMEVSSNHESIPHGLLDKGVMI